MKIALLSDLHLSVLPFEPPATDADVVVLAGDIHRPAAAIEWARRWYDGRPVLFVAGNHEFYGGDLQGTWRELRALAEGSSIRVLERDAWRFGGVRFLGCTLWSDHRYYASREQRDEALAKVSTLVRDFTRIRVAPDFDALFSAAVSQLLFDQLVEWLEQQFAASREPTVVVTHFAPSAGSVAERFKGSPLNACFVSELDERIRRWQPLAWLHGHVHDSFDYRIGDTRVVANPRGYAPKGRIENQAFDPALVITVEG